MKRIKWLAAAGGAASLLAVGAGSVLAYGGPPDWPSATQHQVTQSDRQQQMLELHQQLGIPAGQALHLHDGTGPHGLMGTGVGTGPAECPYHNAE